MKLDTFEIKVPGTNFVIKSNTIYTVKPKPDPNAPDGFKKEGTTKVIHPNIGDTISGPFDTEMGVWNTGFTEHSPCLRGMSDSEKREFLKVVKQHIVEPVEAIKGPGTLRHNAENTFFDEFVVTIVNKLAFNTAEPLQLLALYLAVLGKQLAPSDEVSNPQFKFASFQVINREKEINAKDQSTIDSGKAMGEFYMLLKSDKEKLLTIFKYLKVSDTLIQDEGVFITVFNRFLNDKEDGYRNGKIFLEHVEKFDTEEGETELSAFKMLDNLYDKKQVKVIKKEYYLKNYNLGNSLKHAATKVANDPELYKLVLELTADEEQTEDAE